MKIGSSERATHHQLSKALRFRFVVAGVVMLFGTAQGAGNEIKAAPVAPTRPSQTEYFGTVVSDPYRWMERTDDPDLAPWLSAQDREARAVLARAPRNKKFLRRVQELSGATVEVKGVTRAGNRYFYLKRPVGANDFRLCVRDGLRSDDRVLVNPETIVDKAVHHSIDYFRPSNDGKLVAYGISTGGSEESVMHLVDATSGRSLSDTLERAVIEPQWRADHRSFYYLRLQEPQPNAPPTSRHEKAKTYLHVVGSAQESDTVVFGWGVSSRVPVAPAEYASVFTLHGTRYVIGTVRRGVEPRFDIYVVPSDKVTEKNAPWRKIAGFDDQVSTLDARGNELYVLSSRGAPRSTLLRVNLDHGDIAHAEVMIPPSELTLEEVSVALDALYVRASENGTARLLRVPFADAKPVRVPLPFDGSMVSLSTEPTVPGALFKMQSWVRPPAIYSYVPNQSVVDTELLPPSSIDVSDFQSEETTVPSSGGVTVPLSIVHRRGMKLDGTAITWLSAYGSYGISSDARFEARRVAWLESGGVYAMCHPRGGGERGEEWHQAGVKQRKQNTIADAIACAEYLIAHKYTAAAHLGIEGASAGGIAAGGAMVQQPALFGAAVLGVPIVDTIAFERSAGGNSNAKEFGSANVREELPSMLGTSPYHRVRDGVRYPAVLLMTAVNDRRVPMSQAAKMAARLQAATTSDKPVLLRIEGDAGHGIVGSTRSQVDAELADVYSFLAWQLGDHPTSTLESTRSGSASLQQ